MDVACELLLLRASQQPDAADAAGPVALMARDSPDPRMRCTMRCWQGDSCAEDRTEAICTSEAKRLCPVVGPTAEANTCVSDCLTCGGYNVDGTTCGENPTIESCFDEMEANDAGIIAQKYLCPLVACGIHGGAIRRPTSPARGVPF